MFFDLIWVNKFTELFFCSKLTFFCLFFKDTWSKWMISSNYKVLIEKFSYQIFCHLPSKISCSIFRVKTGSFKDSSHKRDTCGTFLLLTLFIKGAVHILRTCFLDLFLPTHPPCTPIVLQWETHPLVYVLHRLTHPPQKVFKNAL